MNSLKLRARTELNWLAASAVLVAAATYGVLRAGWWAPVAAAGVLYAATWVPSVRRAVVWRRPRRGGGVSDPVLPRRVAEHVSDRAMVNGHAARLRRDWELVCTEGKMYRGTGDNAQFPTLVYARRDGDTLAVGFRPFISEGENTWGNQAHVIRRAVKGQTVRWWIDPTDSGLLEVRIGLTPLPPKVALTAPPPPVPVDGTGGFYIGPMAGGGDAVWRPLEASHLMIAGVTNGGKGGAIRLVIAQAPLWQVRIWNPKVSGEFRWADRLPDCRVATTTRDAVDMLREIDEWRRGVQALISERGVDRWTDLPKHERPRPLLLVVDEASEALDGNDTETITAAELLVTQARMIRSAGGAIVVATQRPDVTGGALGPRGGQLRAQLAARMVVGNIDQAGLAMTIPAGKAQAATLPGIQGRAIVSGLDGSGGADISVVQVAWLSQEVAALAAGAPLPNRVPNSGTAVSRPHTPQGGCVLDRKSEVPELPEHVRDGGVAPSDGDVPAATATPANDGVSAPPDPGTGGDDARHGPPVGESAGASSDGESAWREMRLVEAAAHLGVGERQLRNRLKRGDPHARYVRRGVVAVRDTETAGTAA